MLCFEIRYFGNKNLLKKFVCSNSQIYSDKCALFQFAKESISEMKSVEKSIAGILAL